MLLLSILIFCLPYVFSEDPVITLPNGKIRGIAARTSRYHVKFYAYLGIPFAAPPIGNLRFKPPQPVENWDGILETKTNDKICYQVGRYSDMATEDCLYINVYTPAAPGTNFSLPVMYNIYGGGFTYGYAMLGLNGPEFILEQDVIVVTINYRLGPFGFLSTRDIVIPGNMGMKDQQFGLKWVQKNIHLFGGDPTKVTIIGQSAGSASITFQILSPGSAGLFRAAIGQSGSALCTWGYQRHAVETAYGIAAEIDPSFTRERTSEELLEFLQSVDVQAITNTSDNFSVFAPVLEVEHEGAFITEPMYEAVKNGRFNRVPLLIGMMSEEEVRLASDIPQLRMDIASLEDPYYQLADEDMNILDLHIRSIAAEDIRRIYTRGLMQHNLTAAIQYFSDNMFVRGTIRYAELQSKFTDVYFYQFSYNGLLGGNNATWKDLGKVCHLEDTNYLWAMQNGTDLRLYPKSDVTTLNRYVGFFTNFAKTLNPTPRKSSLFQNKIWPTVSENKFNYLDLNRNIRIKQNPRDFSFGKWVKIYDTFAMKPHISY